MRYNDEVMKYKTIKKGKFMDRPNRFLAHVEVEGRIETVHVKNTGRCKELLIPGASVILEDCAFSTGRRTRYSLISVQKGDRLVNIDSQAPNQIAREYIPRLYPDVKRVLAEQRFGHSRLDFYAETGEERGIWIEVKGVTLEQDGAVLFPDAPTERGIRHLEALMQCLSLGYRACVLFVVQLEGARCFLPNDRAHPAFGETLRRAAEAGVQIRAVDCSVTQDSIIPGKEVEVCL